jgi:uncharacterized protein YbjT (DUF2867 family)
VRAAMPGAVILRPSVVFGPDGAFFNRFAAMARLLWVMPVIGGDTKLQPVYVGDVADAVMAGLTQGSAAGGTFELGGPRVATLRELQAWVLTLIQRKRMMIDVPAGIAALQAKILERLPGRLLTQDQLKLLARDNVVAAGAPGLAALGIAATPMEMVVPRYLVRYRPGGLRREGYAAA